MPNSAVLSVSSASGTVPGTLLNGSIRLADGAHGIALLQYRLPASRRGVRPAAVPELTPITVSYGPVPVGMETFYGYVHHHEILPTTDAGTFLLEYTLIGASLPLNQQKTRSWTGVTASYVARAIAADHGFRSYVHKHDRVFDFIAQEGISDLALLQRLANEIGYRLWSHNGGIWFVDPAVQIAGPKNRNVPTYTMNKVPGIRDSLSSLTVINGSMVGTNGILANRETFGYDPRSQTLIRAKNSSNGAFLSLVENGAVSSWSDAYATLTAAKARNRNWVTATAVVDGTAHLRPGSIVLLNGGAMTSAITGYWLVTKAEHEIAVGFPGRAETQRFSTNLELVRNTDETVTFDDVQTLSPDRESATARLNHRGLWEADIIEEVRLG